jgi:hypothetical protein
VLEDTALVKCRASHNDGKTLRQCSCLPAERDEEEELREFQFCQGKRMKTICLRGVAPFVLLCILPLSGAFSGYDPGVPDTVRLGNLATDLQGPPYQGTAILPVIVFNDEYLTLALIPVGWTGSLELDSGVFAGERAPYIQDWGGVDFAPGNQLVIFGFALPLGYPFCPPGDDTLAYLFFSVQDTGFASFDTCRPPGPAENYLHFVDTLVYDVNPYFEGPREYHIVATRLPGDVNGDGETNVGDIVFLVNYLYRGGIPPDDPEAADVNGDCVVDVGDVAYLVNYLYRNSAAPLAGCA